MTRILLSAGLVLGFAAVAGAQQPAQSLFQRLGGQPAISAVANDLADRILADKSLAQWFVHASSTPEAERSYRGKLTDFLCQATGGPCQYKGLNMVEAHKGRGIPESGFNRVVDHVKATLAKFNVPQKEQGEVLTLLGGLKSSIVEKK